MAGTLPPACNRSLVAQPPWRRPDLVLHVVGLAQLGGEDIPEALFEFSELSPLCRQEVQFLLCRSLDTWGREQKDMESGEQLDPRFSKLI